MSKKISQQGRRCLQTAWLVLWPCALVPSCDSKPPRTLSFSSQDGSTLADDRAELAATMEKLARSKSDQGRFDESLALSVRALEIAPSNAPAHSLVLDLLGNVSWHLPETTIHHGMQVDHLHFAQPSTLWVSLSGMKNTLVRWNLNSHRIEDTLFPIDCAATRSLVFDPTQRSVVIERGGAALLCDATTLRPIRELGALPASLTPSAVVAFSHDGLLIAHPMTGKGEPSSITWCIRDVASGEIIRSSEPAPPGEPRALAAFLDRKQLRVLRQDGSLWTMPLSPITATEVTEPREKCSFLHARFADDGSSALVLSDQGPHLAAVSQRIPLGHGDDSSLDPIELLKHEAWSLYPSLWTGLCKDSPLSLQVRENEAQLAFTNILRSEHPVTAATFTDKHTFIADRSGAVTIYRNFAKPEKIANAPPPATPDPAALAALQNILRALAGTSYDPTTQKFVRHSADQRIQSLKSCDFQALLRIVPELDFRPVTQAIESFKIEPAPPDALAHLTERLALASADLKYPELETAFAQANAEVTLAAIQSAGGKGPAAARALALALQSTRPEWIEACLAAAEDLPPLLRQISSSRIAWLQGRKADALSDWNDYFPNLTEVRLREDWEGWEAADFSPALENLRQCIHEELAAIELPKDPTPEQRKAVITRLTNPSTVTTLGRARFASACLAAALVISADKEEAAATFQLAKLAREMGAPAAPCLRAEALALTALGDYQNAHPRWIELITEHPVETTLSADYAEAAYTAFENSAPRQAMEILTTGMHRFPQDGNFALRAGWVALLTGNSERAYRFLREGQHIGFPADKLENGVALLTIAAAQTGATDDAAVYFKELLQIDPAWANPTTLDTLDWPEELKSTLGEFLH
jgi:tetratricopeptide (TPR) repeat protein